MYLKSITLHGFKSFAQKTKFDFVQGVTGIVGPNGCGKSNIVDAIRWVLGETSAKALRGEMADVIFNGTDARRAVGMAEVCLVLANCEETLGVDYNEVQISRRVFRDGKGEYLLNGTLCRLRDIHELLMDTGLGRSAYSIMEQGKIDLLLSAKPEDRRQVFEEAAGITKFKTQKKETLRKLDYTDANLLRVEDILAEVKRNMNSLKRQAGKARRFQSILEDVKVLDCEHSHRTFTSLGAEAGEIATALHSLSTERDEKTRAANELEEALSARRTELRELEAKVESLSRDAEARRSSLQEARSQIRFNAERTAELEDRRNAALAEIAEIQEKVSAESGDLDHANTALSQVESTIADHQEKVESAGRALTEIQKGRNEMEQELSRLRREATGNEERRINTLAQIEATQSAIAADARRAEQLNADLADLESKHGGIQAQLTGFVDTIAAATADVARHEGDLKAGQRELQETTARRTDLRTKLEEVGVNLTKARARAEAVHHLLADGEGLTEGGQAVLAGLDDPGLYQATVKGALANFIEVDGDFYKPVEAALGQHLQALIVDDREIAISILEKLDEGRLGEVALLPGDLLPKKTEGQMLTVPDQATAWAIDKINAQPAVQGLIEALLHRVLIVGDIKTGLELRDSMEDVTFVTFAGQVITPEGKITGGTRSEDVSTVLERRREYVGLGNDCLSLQREEDSLVAKLEELSDNEAAAAEKVAASADALQEARVLLSSLQGNQGLAQREGQGFDGKLKTARWEREELSTREAENHSKTSSLEADAARLADELGASRVAIAQLERKVGEAALEESAAIEKVSGARTAYAVEERALQALRDQRDPLAHRISELNTLLERRGSEAEDFVQRSAQTTAQSEELADRAKADEAALGEIDTSLTEVAKLRKEKADGLAGDEDALAGLRREAAQLGEKHNAEELRRTKVELKAETLTTHIRERYQVDLETFEPDPHQLLATLTERVKARATREKRQRTREADGSSAEQEAGQDDVADLSLEEPGAIPGEPDWDEVGSIVGELRQRLESMGSVNMDAIEEFEAHEERYTFLEREHSDLITSKEELLQVIAQINRTTRAKFAETFEAVRKNFQATFRDLFGHGARANLILLDESDPLESGIDIVAKPPGKKLQSISLLSGGERSLTAVAMLFSIYMHKPSPFCVLDELDAPLDEANIGRFLNMLDRFIGQSQFVIVTHSKRTMSRLDVMYGITMEEFGVSKAVGMHFEGGEHYKADSEALGEMAEEEDAPALPSPEEG